MLKLYWIPDQNVITYTKKGFSLQLSEKGNFASLCFPDIVSLDSHCMSINLVHLMVNLTKVQIKPVVVVNKMAVVIYNNYDFTRKLSVVIKI